MKIHEKVSSAVTRIACSAALLFSLAVPAKSATYSILNWELRNIVGQSGNGGVVGNYGTLSATYISTTGDTDHLIRFSSTGDLDGFGTAGDTFEFVLRVEAFTGSTVTGGEVTVGTQYDLFGNDGAPTSGNQHFGPTFTTVSGDSFRLSIESVSYVRGEDGQSYAAIFEGFDTIAGYGASAGKEYYVGEGAESQLFTATGNPVTLTSPANAPEMLVTNMSTGATRFRDLDFSFELTETVIPEPSSLALLGLGSFGLLLRRRR
eukprot:g3598.t1